MNSMLFRFVYGLIAVGMIASCAQPSLTRDSRLTDRDVLPPEPGVYDNASEAPHYQFIRSAKESIEIEIYEMKDPDMKSALMEAAERNVKIRIVMEPKPVGAFCDLFGAQRPEGEDCAQRWDSMEDLKSRGAEVRPFAKELCGATNTCFQHGKLIIADGQSALVSTGNFNGSSLCNSRVNPTKCNRDLTIVTRDRWAVSGLSKVFERDFDGTPYGVSSILGQGTQARISVSPIAQPSLISFIDGAQESVQVQAQYLKEPHLNEALKRASQRGVDVRVTLASACSFGRVSPATAVKITENLLPLDMSGIQIRMFTSRNIIGGRPGYMHSKAIVVDGARGWVGSINGSSMSMLSNREFGVFFENPTWVNKLNTIVESDFMSPANETWRNNVRCQGEVRQGQPVPTPDSPDEIPDASWDE